MLSAPLSKDSSKKIGFQMQNSDKTPKWLVLLMAPYFMLNVVYGGFSAIMPIVVGPAFGFSILQIRLIFVASYLLKAVAMLAMRKNIFIALIILTTGCTIGTWLAFPINWHNLSTQMLPIDWGMLGLLLYTLFIRIKS